MSSWNYVGGTFQPFAINNLNLRRAQLQQQQQQHQSASTHASSPDVTTGDFVEVANIVTSTTPPVVQATHLSPVVIGVATSKPSQTTAIVKSHGLAFAWVTKGSQDAPLSGFYAKSINGVHECNVVVDVQGNSFTIAATKDKELEEIIARFNALAS